VTLLPARVPIEAPLQTPLVRLPLRNRSEARCGGLR
jgi:hypothetical protein